MICNDTGTCTSIGGVVGDAQKILQYKKDFLISFGLGVLMLSKRANQCFLKLCLSHVQKTLDPCIIAPYKRCGKDLGP